MFVPTGMPFESARDTVAQFIQQAPPLQALGLPSERSVLQADTVDSPDNKPFIVIRWGEQEATLGESRVHPFDIWVYDDFGDYNRANALARGTARFLVDNLLQVETLYGRISQIVDRGIGGDLADDGFEALVIPYHFAAIGRGL